MIRMKDGQVQLTLTMGDESKILRFLHCDRQSSKIVLYPVPVDADNLNGLVEVGGGDGAVVEVELDYYHVIDTDATGVQGYDIEELCLYIFSLTVGIAPMTRLPHFEETLIVALQIPGIAVVAIIVGHRFPESDNRGLTILAETALLVMEGSKHN